MSEEAIQICHQCDSPMDVSELAPFTRVKCADCQTEQRVKAEFGNYTVVRRHALGGMSVVYLAKDNTLGREVALKVLNEEYSGQEKRIEQFEKEAELTASVTHPNIVKVYTVGRAWGHFYLSMEMLSGDSLEQMMRASGALSEDELIPYAIQIVHGLRAANDAGLIHRDMKPGNILVVDEVVKIVDFGLALMTQGGEAQAEEVWATPFYVSPETLDGKSENFRSDIYALGATLYHAMSGTPPFETDSTSTNVLREAKNHIRPLCEVADWVAPSTGDVIDRMMRVNEEERHSSYDELEEDLNWALKSLHEEGLERPTTVLSRQRAVRREKQKKLKLGIAGGVAAVCAIGAAALFSNQEEAKIPQDAEIANFAPTGPAVTGQKIDSGAAVRIGKAYRQARQAIEENDFKRAEGFFANIFQDEKAQEPTVSWARFEHGIMGYMQGNSHDAQKRMSDLNNHLVNLPEKHKQAIPVGMENLVSRLTEIPTVQLDEGPLDPSNSMEMMALFSFGLKNWEQGDFEMATKWFKQFRFLSAKNDWVKGYQKVAQHYIKDYEVMEPVLNEGNLESTRALAKQSEVYEGVLKKIKTRGRAKFQIRSRMADLVVLHQRAQKKEKDDQQRQAMARQSLFEHQLDKAYQEAALQRYPQALKILESTDANDALDENQKEALIYLVTNAQSFFTNIQQSTESGYQQTKIKSRDEKASYQTIHSITGEGLKMQSGQGSVLLKWDEIAIESLLSLHLKSEASAKSSTERAQLREYIIAFSWLAGEREKANQAAQDLVNENTTFKKNWALIKHLEHLQSIKPSSSEEVKSP